jgi:isoleucyl-tRNA synthetase
MSTEATTEKKNYKTTLNLPQTAFAMEAKLVQSEPVRLKKWEALGLYEKIQELRKDDPTWVLHDGPPFANGDIHIGHLINKTLKDVILRFRTIQGHRTPYVPGWDCHGLPIEHKIAEQIKKEGKNIREMSVLEVRKRCFEYASKYVSVQREQFKRLGILGDWENPYETMKPAYEASTLEVFAKFVEAGLVYRKLKPVPWSIANQTALADAELEYQDVQDTSVYVEFPIVDHAAVEKLFGHLPSPVRLMVWTTTPWTLPANLAIAVNPNVEYVVATVTPNAPASAPPRSYIIAKDLCEKVLNSRAATGPGNHEISYTTPLPGIDLVEAGLQYRHPFIDRTGKVVLAEYVTTTDGTGLVHTAPGHGEDDYETGIREKLEVYSPVLANGRFDDTVPEWLRGKSVMKEGNPLIIEQLTKDGFLFAQQTITHSYPHDWRSKTPIIFRATEQWFVAMDKPCSVGGRSESLRKRATEAANGPIEFVPKWGQARLNGMLESRPDWCVSRQRAWGLPIPVFYNEKGDALLTPQSVRAVAKRFEENGSDIWFTAEPAELLGADFRYPPGFSPTGLRKEKDIFDVWFESGSSWHAVLQARPSLSFPADLYLEGSDQHRGWFQLSLLPSLGATGKAPFKQVLTHGFVVKPDGTKVSKSDKEYVTATTEIDRYGADVLRLWCCSVDYQNDIPASPKAIQEFSDKYRKIRNTLRFLLSNLYDFDPHGQQPDPPLQSLDMWVLHKLDRLIDAVEHEYDSYQLHKAFRHLHDFCSVDLSAVYGNAMKDRLYCEAVDSPLRRQCQSVMHRVVLVLTKLLSPMLIFTADEVWEHIPHKPTEDADLPSVHMALFPKRLYPVDKQLPMDEWVTLMQLRDSALSQLDALKKEVGLNKALDAEIVYQIGDATLLARLEKFGVDLEDLVGAGYHTFADTPASQSATVKVIDTRTKYAACARSWKRRPDVGKDSEYPDLSARDAAVVKKLK